MSQIVGPRPPSSTAPSTCGLAALWDVDRQAYAGNYWWDNASSKRLAESSRAFFPPPARVCDRITSRVSILLTNINFVQVLLRGTTKTEMADGSFIR